MTTTEIKALVATKIAGQGTNVDAASVLPTIINALCDAVDAASAAIPAELRNIPVVTENLDDGDDVELSDEKFHEYTTNGLLLYKGLVFTLCCDDSKVGEYVSNASGQTGSLYLSCLLTDDKGTIDATTYIIVYTTAAGKFFIGKVEI